MDLAQVAEHAATDARNDHDGKTDRFSAARLNHWYPSGAIRSAYQIAYAAAHTAWSSSKDLTFDDVHRKATNAVRQAAAPPPAGTHPQTAAPRATWRYLLARHPRGGLHLRGYSRSGSGPEQLVDVSEPFQGEQLQGYFEGRGERVRWTMKRCAWRDEAEVDAAARTAWTILATLTPEATGD